jgi:hypothetical protein
VTEAEWLAATAPQPMLDHLGDKASARKLRLFACACVRRVWHLLPAGALRRGIDVAERRADGTCDDAEHARTAREAADAYAAVGGPGNLAYEQYIYDGYMDWHPANVFDEDERERCWDTIETAARKARLTRRGAARVIARYEAAMAAYLATFREIPPRGYAAHNHAHEGAAVAVWEAAWKGALPQEDDAERFVRPDPRELAYQSGLLRDIFGNPFARRVRLEPAWFAWQGGIVPRLARFAYQERDLPEGALGLGRLGALSDVLEEAGCTEADLLGHLRSPGPHFRGCWALDFVLGKE